MTRYVRLFIFNRIASYSRDRDVYSTSENKEILVLPQNPYSDYHFPSILPSIPTLIQAAASLPLHLPVPLPLTSLKPRARSPTRDSN